MKNQILIFICAAFLLIIFSGEAFACKCAPTKASVRFASADKVFQGEILSIRKTDENLYAVFKVETSWKGVTKDKIVVSTPTHSCGESFAVGETKLLWVNKDNSTQSCDNHIEAGSEFLQNKPKLNLTLSNLSNDGIPPQHPESGETSNSEELGEQPSKSNENSSTFDYSTIAIGVFAFLGLFFIFLAILCVIIILLKRKKK